MLALMRCFQRAARIVSPPRWGGNAPAEHLGRLSRDRCRASRPTGRLRAGKRRASIGLRGEEGRGEGVDQADPRWWYGVRAPGGPGELPAP